MSNGKFTIKLLFLSLAALCLATSVSAFSVFAEPDETYAIESFVADTTQWVEDTYSDETYEDYTEEYYEETEDFTEEYVEPEYTEAESTAETVASSEVNGSTSATQVTTEATEPSYRAPLPEIEDTEITPPTVVGAVEDREEPTLFWGFVSWILIGVGVAVVFAVVLSTKAKAYRGGRDRYSNTDKISGKKKLLPQNYYDKRKRK